MEIYEAIRRRRSCRLFTPEVPPREALERIVEAATWAPSVKNRDNWLILVVRGRTRDRLAELSARSLLRQESSLRRLFREKTVGFTWGFFRQFGGGAGGPGLLRRQPRRRPGLAPESEVLEDGATTRGSSIDAMIRSAPPQSGNPGGSAAKTFLMKRAHAAA